MFEGFLSIPRAACVAAAIALVGGCVPRERVVAFKNEGDAGGGGAGGVAGAGGPFGAPTPFAGLLDPTDLVQDPSLSPDELEIYFAAVKNGTYDIWMSARPAVGQPWRAAVPVAELSTASDDYEPDLSADGLTLHFSSDRPNTSPFRIWVSHRGSRSDPWGVPQPVDLGMSRSDRGPTMDARGLTLVFVSEPSQVDLELYLATRSSPTAAWGPPRSLDEINSPAFDWDPGLFRGGLGLVFASRRDRLNDASHLYETSRSSEGSRFSPPRPLVELNGARSEGDPWLSDDGRHIVFASERTGVSRLYEAWR
ncbi:MAG: hypothetical protein ABUL77_04160 [Bacteroidota bacterium]